MRFQGEGDQGQDSKRTEQDTWLFLAMGVGRNLTMGGMVYWELTKASGANGEKLVVGKAVGR